jgi:hypothetical protein
MVQGTRWARAYNRQRESKDTRKRSVTQQKLPQDGSARGAPTKGAEKATQRVDYCKPSTDDDDVPADGLH